MKTKYKENKVVSNEQKPRTSSRIQVQTTFMCSGNSTDPFRYITADRIINGQRDLDAAYAAISAIGMEIQ